MNTPPFTLLIVSIYLFYVVLAVGMCCRNNEMRHTQATLAYLDERVGSDVRLVRTETTACLAWMLWQCCACGFRLDWVALLA